MKDQSLSAAYVMNQKPGLSVDHVIPLTTAREIVNWRTEDVTDLSVIQWSSGRWTQEEEDWWL